MIASLIILKTFIQNKCLKTNINKVLCKAYLKALIRWLTASITNVKGIEILKPGVSDMQMYISEIHLYWKVTLVVGLLFLISLNNF